MINDFDARHGPGHISGIGKISVDDFWPKTLQIGFQPRGEIIQHTDAPTLGRQRLDEMRPNKPRATRDQAEFFHAQHLSQVSRSGEVF